MKKVVFYMALSLSCQLFATQNITLKDVTVTAQKSEEKLRKVPISVTAFDESDIEDKQISNLGDIAKFTPNLLLYNTGQQGLTWPSVRGISANISPLSTPVALYVDGIAYMNSFGYGDELEDIERIEILRGPQGSLYGANSQSGVINVISKKPDNETGAKATAKIGNKGRLDIGANAAGAIVKDVFYIGVSAKHTQKDGFIKDAHSGNITNDKKSDYAKIYLRYTPKDDLEFALIGSKLWVDNGAHDISKTTDRITSTNMPTASKPTTGNLSFHINYDINDKDKISSTTAYRRHHDKVNFDADLTPRTVRHIFKDNYYTSYSEELKYELNLDKFKLLSGIYLLKSKADNDTVFKTVMDPSGASSRPSSVISKDISIFENLSYRFNDNFTAEIGLRASRQTSKFNSQNLSQNQKYDNLSPKIALRYDIDAKNSAYVSITEGYRAGGFNTLTQNKDLLKFDEETLISYELGYKGFLFDDRLFMSADIFYMDIDDMQVEIAMPVSSRTIKYIANAATATSKGLEAEFTALLNKNLSIFAGLGVSEAKFKNYKDTQGDYSGKTVPLAPKYTYNLGLQYRNLGYFARADVYGFSKIYFDRENSHKQDSYNLVDLKLGYEFKNLDVYFYAKNIFNKRHDAMGGFLAGAANVLSEDREFGLQFTYRL